jgi:acyl carrier protein
MSDARARLVNVFAESLLIDPAMVKPDLTYNSIPAWDSVAHMTLVAAIDQEFDLMLDTDDIIGMSSVAKAEEILRKHGVTLP